MIIYPICNLLYSVNLQIQVLIEKIDTIQGESVMTQKYTGEIIGE